MKNAKCLKVISLEGRIVTCDCPAEPGVTLATPAGRPPAVGRPYCNQHGGRERSKSEARRDWNFAAPACVGGVEEVNEAGLACLNSTHAYLVLRQDGLKWLAYLGVGSFIDQVEAGICGQGQHLCGKCIRRERRGLGSGCGATVKGFGSQAAAEARGRDVWASRLSARMEEILRLRGGDLSWGLPVSPLEEPIVLRCGPGQCAWDVATDCNREARIGAGWLTGLRPSGEAS